MTKPMTIIGGGLAGSEAAWQLAKRNVPVTLYEMRPAGKTNAHQTARFAELVGSNSFRSSDAQSNAIGLLQAEMRLAGSLIMTCADRNQIEVNDELTIDRKGFSDEVTKSLENEPLITIKREEYKRLPSKDDGSFIIASST